MSGECEHCVAASGYLHKSRYSQIPPYQLLPWRYCHVSSSLYSCMDGEGREKGEGEEGEELNEKRSGAMGHVFLFVFFFDIIQKDPRRRA